MMTVFLFDRKKTVIFLCSVTVSKYEQNEFLN